MDAVLDLVSISSLVSRRPVLAEGCFNLLFSVLKDARLSMHVLDVAQVGLRCKLVCTLGSRTLVQEGGSRLRPSRFVADRMSAVALVVRWS
jgi:hypothetical protein